MSTHERELTEPVSLALADGRTLDPAARGWSRRPLHRANLHGGWGRTKRWDYWAILAGDLVVSSVYADVDYLGLADVWWADLATGRSGGRGITVPGARGMKLPDVPGSAPLRVDRRHLALEITDDADGTTQLRARWRERDGREGRLRAEVELPAGHESLNVVIPWSERRFQYTSKHQARPARGELVVGGQRWAFGAGVDGAHDDAAWGVLDVGRGRWPYRTRWNWGGGAGEAHPGGPIVGLQLGGRWTEGTGYTENGVLVDGVLHKLGSELRWDYAWDDPLLPWRVQDPDGRLEVVLAARFDKHTRIEALLMGTETHQVFGTWSGRFTPDSGATIDLEGVLGFAEESRSRW
jgi:Domain of unknown function (DUF2804), N-terminal/Domain of unknown function (DUF2804), C-terminal